jgi:hypothetical protein
VHELQALELRTHGPERLDEPEVEATAAVHCQPRGLVEHNKLVVLENHCVLQSLLPAGGSHRRRSALAHGQRRQPNHVARMQSLVRFCPALVHAHFPLADSAVQTGFGHPRDVTQHVVVETLSVSPRIHGQPLHPRNSARGGRFSVRALVWTLVRALVGAFAGAHI